MGIFINDFESKYLKIKNKSERTHFDRIIRKVIWRYEYSRIML